jgi:hypothetical protein
MDGDYALLTIEMESPGIIMPSGGGSDVIKLTGKKRKNEKKLVILGK